MFATLTGSEGRNSLLDHMFRLRTYNSITPSFASSGSLTTSCRHKPSIAHIHTSLCSRLPNDSTTNPNSGRLMWIAFFPSTFQSGAPQIRSVCSELSRRGATPDGLARPIDHLISSPAARARNTNLPDLLLRLLKLQDCFRPGLAYPINCVIKCDFAYGAVPCVQMLRSFSSVPFSIHPGAGGDGKR